MKPIFTRRAVLACGSAAAALLPLTGARRPSKPNIIVIYADDLGYGDLSCYGAGAIRTPNLDRLASRGTRFVNAHSPSATCTFVCARTASASVDAEPSCRYGAVAHTSRNVGASMPVIVPPSRCPVAASIVPTFIRFAAALALNFVPL